jgi:DNA-binding response OmpR family regulator
MLPGISGIELITMVRASAQTAKIPILMISGHSNYAMDARAKSAGADHFLNKPFTLTQLRSTVTALASKYRPLSAAEQAAIAAKTPGPKEGPPVPAVDPSPSGIIRVTSTSPISDAQNINKPGTR